MCSCLYVQTESQEMECLLILYRNQCSYRICPRLRPSRKIEKDYFFIWDSIYRDSGCIRLNSEKLFFQVRRFSCGSMWFRIPWAMFNLMIKKFWPNSQEIRLDKKNFDKNFNCIGSTYIRRYFSLKVCHVNTDLHPPCLRFQSFDSELVLEKCIWPHTADIFKFNCEDFTL